jgi:hypothetical protein
MRGRFTLIWATQYQAHCALYGIGADAAQALLAQPIRSAAFARDDSGDTLVAKPSYRIATLFARMH